MWWYFCQPWTTVEISLQCVYETCQIKPTRHLLRPVRSMAPHSVLWHEQVNLRQLSKFVLCLDLSRLRISKLHLYSAQFNSNLEYLKHLLCARHLNWRLCFKFWTKWGYGIAGQPCAKLDTFTTHVTKAVLSTNHEKVPSQTKSHGNKLQQHQRQWKGSCFCSSCRSTQSWYYLRIWV